MIVILQDTLCGTFRIVELAAPQAPEEGDKAEPAKREGDGD